MTKSIRKAKRKAAVRKKTVAESKTVLVLRTCTKDMTSYNGFKWPTEGQVEAPDWQPTKECGHGLHGWLWGSGNWELKIKGEKTKWLVLEVERESIIDLDGKVKFPRCTVKSVHDHWPQAMKVIRERILQDRALEAINSTDDGHAAAQGLRQCQKQALPWRVRLWFDRPFHASWKPPTT